MKKNLTVLFTEFDETVSIQLDDSQSPKTVKAILDNLPVEVNIHKWGQELYTDNTQIAVQEENARAEVNLLDVAYWPEGGALCLFYGPTPNSKDGDKILPYSPVNIVGKILFNDNNIINRVKDTTKVVIKQQEQ